MSNIQINHRAITKILGTVLFVVGIVMIIPGIYAAKTSETSTAMGFAIASIFAIIVGGFTSFGLKSDRAKFRTREGYIVVASAWSIAIIIGAFPYFFSNAVPTFIDALFESASGFTTTGCSCVNGTELPRALILWKAMCNWFGGMGILVFAISILPALGINGQFVARAETPGPVLQKTAVRMSDSAKFLYITYFIFTIAEFVLLLASGKMPVYDAVVNTLGGISTGGVTVHAEGIAYYNSLFVEIVISTFCILSSINFVLYHYAITGHVDYLLKDVELRAYVVIIISSVIICASCLVFYNDLSWQEALRESGFQVVSMATTAGYVRTPSLIWPATCQMILIVLIFIGGCSSSTSGSIKVMRILVMVKLIFRGCVRRIHPRSVVAVRFGKDSVSAPVVSGISAFILTYIALIIVSIFVLSFQGLPIEASLSATLAMISNTGSAPFGASASLDNFYMFHPVLKLYLSALMIMGRLELFPILILFSRRFWGKNH